MTLAREARHLGEITTAFARQGWLLTSSYPLSFVLGQLSGLVQPIIYYFVAQLVGPGAGPAVGGDYYTFVIIGVLSLQLLSAGLQGVGTALDQVVSEGTFEILLLQPVRWRFLPFGWSVWPTLIRLGTVATLLALALLLGARFALSGLLPALFVLVLGMLASLGVGTLAASLKVLAKRGDPVLSVYLLATTVLSGVFFPLEQLPGPVRALSWLLPHTYVIQALRRLLMPAAEILPGPSAAAAAVGLGVLCAVVMPLSLWLFGRSLDYGRRLGILGSY